MIVVFGCGGERDRAEAPVMGSVATRFADVAVLTSDNPRSEDPLAIIDEVRDGLRRAGHELVVEPDRRRAIATALGRPRPGDVVVVAGKGHETTQQIGGRAVEFDDRDVVAEELGRLGVGAGAVIPLLSPAPCRILVAGFGTPILLRWLVRWRIGQQIRVDGPAHHTVKAGTPTMGGIAILVAVVAGYCLGHVGTSAPFTRPGAARARGRRRRRRGRGRRRLDQGEPAALARAEQAVEDARPRRGRRGVLRAVGGFTGHSVHTTLSFTRYDLPGLELGAVVWVIWGSSIIFGIVERGEPHRRPRRSRRRLVGLRLRCFALIGFVGVPPPGHLPRARRPRPRPGRGGDGRRLRRLFVVERGPARIIMGDTGSLVDRARAWPVWRCR